LFFSDGERGLADWLGPLCKQTQRGHWHAAREVGYALWEDKMSFEERKQRQKQVRELIALEIPEEDIEWVSAEEKAQLRDRIVVADARSPSKAADSNPQHEIDKLNKMGHSHAVGKLHHFFSKNEA